MKEKSEVPSTLAIPPESSNPDVQEVTEDQNNNLSEDAPLVPAPVAFASTDRRFSKGLRGKQRDKMIALVRNYGAWDLKKKWESRTGDSELRLHLEGKGVSRDLIRKMITVSVRKLTRTDYDGIATVIKQIPLAYFATPPEESRGRDAGVNPPVVTIQSTPPHSSSQARKTSDYPRHSSHTGTSISHPLEDLAQPERSRTSTSNIFNETLCNSQRQSY